MFRNGADRNEQDMFDCWMISKFQADTVKLLINYGADVTTQDETFRTPLHLAAFSGSTETVQILIEHGADVTAQDETFRTPLHLAAFSGSTGTVQLLIEHGADVTAQDRSQKTPLHLTFLDVSLESGFCKFSTGLT